MLFSILINQSKQQPRQGKQVIRTGELRLSTKKKYGHKTETFSALLSSFLLSDSQASQAEKAKEALALEIRAKEVEPERQRADASESKLSELRQAAHGWLATAHALKLEAAAEARVNGYTEGRERGRSEGKVAVEAETRSLQMELHEAREVFSELLLRSHGERLSLKEEVVAARGETVGVLAAAGAAATVALTKSREASLAKGRAEGFEAGRLQGLAEGVASGRAEGLALGRADAEVELSERTRAAEEGKVTALTAAAEGEKAGAVVREAFAAYVVHAHEQRLTAVATEKEASRQVVGGLSEELANSQEALAKLLKVRT